MLEASGEGWLLVRSQGWGADESVVVPARIHLVAPDGRPFVVPSAIDPADWYVLDWLPGTPSVLATSIGTQQVRVVDLVTGAEGPVLDHGWTSRFAHDGTADVLVTSWDPGLGTTIRRLAPDGTVESLVASFTAMYGTPELVVSEDGTRAVVNDAAGVRAIRTDDVGPVALAVPYPQRPGACRAWTWVGDEVVLECGAGGGADFAVGSASEFWLVPAGGGDARHLPGMPESTRLGGVWRVGDRLVAGTFGPTESSAGWWDVGGPEPELLASGGSATLDVVAVRDGEVIATDRPVGLDGASTVSALVAVDPLTGVQRRLVESAPAVLASFGVTPSGAVVPQTGVGD
jgi:hypothetical protein